MAAAGTRSGKGTSLVIPNLLTDPDSVVVEDIKEENYLYTSGYRRACGHETYLWAPFSEDGRSHAYNPLEYIQRRAPYTRVGDVMTIGEHLYPSNVDARLKYWNDNARNLFIGIVLYLLETPSLPCTFGEVLRQASGKGRAIREHISSIVSTRADAAHATDGLPALSFECLDALNRFPWATRPSTKVSRRNWVWLIFAGCMKAFLYQSKRCMRRCCSRPNGDVAAAFSATVAVVGGRSRCAASVSLKNLCLMFCSA